MAKLSTSPRRNGIVAEAQVQECARLPPLPHLRRSRAFLNNARGGQHLLLNSA